MKLLICALFLMASMAFVMLGCTDSADPIGSKTTMHFQRHLDRHPWQKEVRSVARFQGKVDIWFLSRVRTLGLSM